MRVVIETLPLASGIEELPKKLESRDLARSVQLIGAVVD